MVCVSPRGICQQHTARRSTVISGLSLQITAIRNEHSGWMSRPLADVPVNLRQRPSLNSAQGHAPFGSGVSSAMTPMRFTGRVRCAS